MNERERIPALRGRLHAIMADAVQHAHDLSRERCPYRAADDKCTFRFGCQNQLRFGDRASCNGAQLNNTAADSR